MLTGGTQASSSSAGRPNVVVAPLACSASAAVRSAAIDADASTRVAAVQSCPALKYAAVAMPSAAAARSASSNTTTGAFPPSSRWVRLRLPPALTATALPAATDPVIATICGVGWETRFAPVTRSPVTTFRTPGGRCLAASSASITVVTGVVSLGLITTVLPAAMAGQIFQIAIIIG